MVALALIFIMSVMGISAMRESTLEKRMAANSVFKASTLQLAETAAELSIANTENLKTAYSAQGTVIKPTLPSHANSSLQSEASLQYAGSGPPIGFSLGVGGGFQALRFVAQGTASLPDVQAQARVSQGAYRTVPALTQ